MNVAITGGTGLIGRPLIRQLLSDGHTIRCLTRHSSVPFPPHPRLEFVVGQLGAPTSRALLAGCDACVHLAHFKQGESFLAQPADVASYLATNLTGSLELIEEAQHQSLERFVLVSSGAVHGRVLDDRPLNEWHPRWPTTHYGALKAALEMFVHSYGAQGFPICCLRPTSVYGGEDPPQRSRWYSLVQLLAEGKRVAATGGAKLVHADDVAAAACVLLKQPAERVTGEIFACCDRFVSDWEFGKLAKEVGRLRGELLGPAKTPKHELETAKLRALGVVFQGESGLRNEAKRLVDLLRTD